jgi:mannosylglycerate hydrolase
MFETENLSFPKGTQMANAMEEPLQADEQVEVKPQEIIQILLNQ